MNSPKLEDISSEDSNIITYFQTFDKNTTIIDPGKEMSQNFAKFEFLCKDEFDIDNPQILDKLNDIYNLILNLISIAESHEKLREDFKEYSNKVFDAFLAKVFTPDTFESFYYLNNKNIDIIWQIHRVLKLIYEYEIPQENYKFFISNDILILSINFYQLPLFKYTKPAIKNPINSDFTRPCNLFRDETKKTFIIKQKIELFQLTLDIILNNCVLSVELLQYFQSILTEIPAYFSYEVFSKQFKLIQSRVKLLTPLPQNLPIIRIANKIDAVIMNLIVKSVSKISQNQYVLTHDPQVATIQIHDFSEPEQFPKPPNWVTHFEFKSTPSHQNSEYDNPNTTQSDESEPEVGSKFHRGFKVKLRNIFKFYF